MTPRPPDELGKAGRKLWRDVMADWAMEGADSYLLREACQVADDLARLKAIQARGTGTGQGMIIPGVIAGSLVVAPWVREIRQQRRLLSDLLRAVKVVGVERAADDPLDDEDDRPLRAVR